ncbi:MAG: SDR family oxidoreductase [Planctomycetota bacterium]
MAENKTCLIIGAAGGIGRSLTTRLHEHGWDLVLAGRRPEPLADLSESVNGRTAVVDAQDPDALQAVFEECGPLGGAVNLAGSILLKPAHSTSPSDFDDTVRQNLLTAFNTVRAAGQAMRKTGGSVVLMSTCAATVGLPNHEAISAAKAGVEGLTRAAAATYSTFGVRFNAVAPGLVDTPLAERITSSEPSLKASTSMHPLGRIGEPADIARAIAFLLDPAASWMTGQVIGVDGGLARIKSR